jgi:hypothetical protein
MCSTFPIKIPRTHRSLQTRHKPVNFRAQLTRNRAPVAGSDLAVSSRAARHIRPDAGDSGGLRPNLLVRDDLSVLLLPYRIDRSLTGCQPLNNIHL